MSERLLLKLMTFVRGNTFSTIAFRLFTTIVFIGLFSLNTANSQLDVSHADPDEVRDEFYSVNLWDEIKKTETIVIGKLSLLKKEKSKYTIRNYWEFKVTHVLNGKIDVEHVIEFRTLDRIPSSDPEFSLQISEYFVKNMSVWDGISHLLKPGDNYLALMNQTPSGKYQPVSMGKHSTVWVDFFSLDNRTNGIVNAVTQIIEIEEDVKNKRIDKFETLRVNLSKQQQANEILRRAAIIELLRVTNRQNTQFRDQDLTFVLKMIADEKNPIDFRVEISDSLSALKEGQTASPKQIGLIISRCLSIWSDTKQNIIAREMAMRCIYRFRKFIRATPSLSQRVLMELHTLKDNKRQRHTGRLKWDGSMNVVVVTLDNKRKSLIQYLQKNNG